MTNKFRKVLPILAIAVLAAIVLPLTSVNHHSLNNTPVLGVSTTSGQYIITVHKFTSGQPDVKSQNRRVTIDLTITNSMANVMQISPGLQMSVLDQQGTSYPATATYLNYGQTIGGPLAAHATKNYEIDFNVPNNAIARNFIFQLDGKTTPTKVQL